MNTKEILKNPGFHLANDIHEIASKYFKEMDFYFFGHVTAYPNGNFSFLATHRDWASKVLAEEKLPPVGFTFYEQITNKVVFPNMDKSNIFGWSDEVTVASKEQFNILNPMMITRKYDDHYEAFVFDLHCKDIYEKYLNNFDVFEKFIHYHKDQSRKMIEKVNQNFLRVDSQYLPQKNKALELSLREGNHVSVPTLKRYYLRHKNKDIVISAKEYYCLSLLAHGKQIKRIAHILGVSLRTVETYFERVKKKLNLPTRNELARVYWDNRILSD